MDLRVHPALDHGSGLLLFFPPPLQLPVPFHTLLTSPPSRLPQAPARPRHPARTMDHLTPVMEVHHPAVQPQTHNLKAQGTDWGPSPAPWDWEAEWTEGMGPPVLENLVPNSSR